MYCYHIRPNIHPSVDNEDVRHIYNRDFLDSSKMRKSFIICRDNRGVYLFFSIYINIYCIIYRWDSTLIRYAFLHALLFSFEAITEVEL